MTFSVLKLRDSPEEIYPCTRTPPWPADERRKKKLCLLLFIRSSASFCSFDSSPRLGLKGFGGNGVKGHLRNVWKKYQKMRHECRLGPRINRLECN